MKAGDRVRVHADGVVDMIDSNEPRIKVELDEPTNGMKRKDWFETSEVEPIVPAPTIDNGWRDVAADMIRLGKIDEALDLIYANRQLYTIPGHNTDTVELCSGDLTFHIINRSAFDYSLAIRTIKATLE